MGRSEKRRQKSLLKRKRKDKIRKKRRHDTTFNVPAFGENYYKNSLVKRAREFPIHECLINPQWQEQGIATILISRRQPNGKLVFGVFIVDVFCLGLKDTFCNADMALGGYEDSLKDMLYMLTSYTDCHPGLAHRIIYGAIDYARELGFEPHKDFKFSRFILNKPSETDISFHVEFGKDGKPFYIAGPDDNVDYILRKLSMRVGNGNFDFLHPIEMRC